MAKIKILFTGHGGSRNRGCEAILRGTIDIIRRHVDPADIIVISYHPPSDRIALGHDIDEIEIHDFSAQRPARFSPHWFMTLFNN